MPQRERPIWQEPVERPERPAPAENPFEITVQIRETALEAILVAQHRRGIMSHARLTFAQGQKSTLVLGRPRVTLIPSSSVTTEILASLEFNSIFSAFYADGYSPIVSEVLNITVHTSTRFANRQNPTPYSRGMQLLLSWTVQASDVVKPTGDAASSETTAGVLGSIGAWEDTFRIPEVSGDFPPVTQIAHRVLFQPDVAESVLAVGLNLEGFGLGSFDQLNEALISHDWVVLLSEEFVLSRVEKALLQFFRDSTSAGALPPPRGTMSVPLPRAPAGTNIDRLSFFFFHGGIRFDGALSFPHGNAHFRFDASIGVVGHAIEVELGFITVDIDLDFAASLADFFSGGDISAGIRHAISSSLSSDVTGHLSGFFTSELLSQLASGGQLAGLRIAPILTSAQISPRGLALHGILSVADTSASPVVTFSTTQIEDSAAARTSAMEQIFARGPLPSHSSHKERSDWAVVLDGTGSWTPGRDIQQFAWHFGDGSSEMSSGGLARAVVRHSYLPGEYVARLRLTDTTGDSETYSRLVRVGDLSLLHLVSEGQPWEVCLVDGPICLEFLVQHEGFAVADAIVLLNTDNWSSQAATDSLGIAALTIDPSQVTLLDPPQGAPAILAGRILASAAKPGHIEIRHNLWIYDCSKTEIAPSRVDELRHELGALFRKWQANDPRAFLTDRWSITPWGGDVADSAELSRAVHIVAELEMLSRATKLIARQETVATGANLPRATTIVPRRSTRHVSRLAAVEGRARHALAELGLGFVSSSNRSTTHRRTP